MNNRQRVIILEGPDMCGKTNIGKALSWRHNIPYFKNESERTFFDELDTDYFANAAKYIDSYMASFLLKTGTSVIFDRAWPSEFVYPKVFGRAGAPMHVLEELDKRWSWLDTRIIIPWRTDYSQITDDVHSQIDPVKLRQIHDAYMEFAKWTSCKVYLLNVDDEDLARELEEIEGFLK